MRKSVKTYPGRFIIYISIYGGSFFFCLFFFCGGEVVLAYGRSFLFLLFYFIIFIFLWVSVW